MSTTGILIAAHGAALTNIMFMPAHSVVIEVGAVKVTCLQQMSAVACRRHSITVCSLITQRSTTTAVTHRQSDGRPSTPVHRFTIRFAILSAIRFAIRFAGLPVPDELATVQAAGGGGRCGPEAWLL